MDLYGDVLMCSKHNTLVMLQSRIIVKRDWISQIAMFQDLQGSARARKTHTHTHTKKSILLELDWMEQVSTDDKWLDVRACVYAQ